MKSWDQLKWLRINIIKQFYSKFFNQLLFNNYYDSVYQQTEKKEKLSSILAHHPIKISKIDLLDFFSEDRISETNPSFIHEKNIKRADSGDPAARNYRGKTLRVAIRAFLFRAPPEIHVVG